MDITILFIKFIASLVTAMADKKITFGEAFHSFKIFLDSKFVPDEVFTFDQKTIDKIVMFYGMIVNLSGSSETAQKIFAVLSFVIAKAKDLRLNKTELIDAVGKALITFELKDATMIDFSKK